MSDAPAPPAGASGSSATTAAAAATAPSKTGTGAPAPAQGADSGEATSLTTIGSMEELKKKAPEVYKMMMQGIATNICNEMRRRGERMKKIWREDRARAGIQT